MRLFQRPIIQLLLDSSVVLFLMINTKNRDKSTDILCRLHRKENLIKKDDFYFETICVLYQDEGTDRVSLYSSHIG